MKKNQSFRVLTKAFLFLFPIALSSCGGDIDPGACTDLYAYGLTVHVVDAITAADICDAMVIAQDGAYMETLQKSGNCDFVGAGERAGTYSVTAQRTGYLNTTQSNIVVGADHCHVQGMHVTLRMSK